MSKRSARSDSTLTDLGSVGHTAQNREQIVTRHLLVNHLNRNGDQDEGRRPTKTFDVFERLVLGTGLT